MLMEDVIKLNILLEIRSIVPLKANFKLHNKYVQFVKEYDTDPNGKGGGVQSKP